MKALCERFDKAWRDRRVECDDCARDCGSDVSKASRDSVESRFKY